MVGPAMTTPPRGQLSIGVAFALLIGAAIAMLGTLFLGAALRMVTQGIGLDEAMRRVQSEPLGPALAQLLALGAMLLVGVRIAYGPDVGLREALRVRPIAPSVALLCFVAGLGMQFSLVEITSVVSDMVPALGFDEEDRRHMAEMVRIDTPLRAIAVPLAIVVIAPLSEELVFRGLLLHALRPRLGTLVSLVTSSLLFALFHLHPAVLVYATVAGLVLGVVTLRTGSVAASIALHAGVNVVPLLLPESVVPIRGFNVAEEQHLPLPILIGTTLVAALALALVWRTTEPEPGPGPPSDDPGA